MRDAIVEMAEKLCPAERDRLTAAEVCIDEILTTLERHKVSESHILFRTLKAVSEGLSGVMFIADGPEDRLERLRRVRDALTDALPLTDEDLGRVHD